MAGATGHVKLAKRKRGDQWYVKYRRPDGRQVERKLSPAWTGNGRPPAGHYTRRTAEEALQAILTDLRRGIGAEDGTGATFAQAATEYLRYVEHVRQVGTVTVKDYRGVIDRYLLPTFGDEPIESITPDMIDSYKEKLIVEGRLSNRGIVRHLTVLHGVFKRAGRVWGLERNPASADLVERPKVVYTGEYRAYEPEEVELLARHAHDERDAAIYLIAAHTGLRQGECLALRWRDVDFVTGLLHVRRNYTSREEKVPKGKRVRSVPMTPHVVDTLARLKERGYLTEDDDLVFSNTAGDHLCAWGYGAATTRRSRPPGYGGWRSTSCGTRSAPTPSGSSTATPCSPTWATPTTRPRSATCTTSHAARTHRSSPTRSASPRAIVPNALRRIARARRRLREVTGQEFSELREGHVLRDETLTATGEAFRRSVANDVAALGYRLEVAPAAALLARHLDGDRWLD
jgi:integrase